MRDKKTTVNEAINYLEDAKIEFKIPKAAVTARKTNEALDMAIKALITATAWRKESQYEQSNLDG